MELEIKVKHMEKMDFHLNLCDVQENLEGFKCQNKILLEALYDSFKHTVVCLPK